MPASKGGLGAAAPTCCPARERTAESCRMPLVAPAGLPLAATRARSCLLPSQQQAAVGGSQLLEAALSIAVRPPCPALLQGDKPHAGFPEAAYHGMAEKLARAGLKVVVVEQTETPDMLKTRNEERAAQGLRKVGGHGPGRWRRRLWRLCQPAVCVPGRRDCRQASCMSGGCLPGGLCVCFAPSGGLPLCTAHQSTTHGHNTRAVRLARRRMWCGARRWPC